MFVNVINLFTDSIHMISLFNILNVFFFAGVGTRVCQHYTKDPNAYPLTYPMLLAAANVRK